MEDGAGNAEMLSLLYKFKSVINSIWITLCFVMCRNAACTLYNVHFCMIRTEKESFGEISIHTIEFHLNLEFCHRKSVYLSVTHCLLPTFTFAESPKRIFVINAIQAKLYNKFA